MSADTTHTQKPQVHAHWDSGACRPWSASHTHAEPQPTQRRALHTPTNPQITNVTHTAPNYTQHSQRVVIWTYVCSQYTYSNQHPANTHTNLLVHTRRLRGISVLTQPIAVVTLREAPGSREAACLASPAGTAIAVYTATRSSVALPGLTLSGLLRWGILAACLAEEIGRAHV